MATWNDTEEYLFQGGLRMCDETYECDERLTGVSFETAIHNMATAIGGKQVRRNEEAVGPGAAVNPQSAPATSLRIVEREVEGLKLDVEELAGKIVNKLCRFTHADPSPLPEADVASVVPALMPTLQAASTSREIVKVIYEFIDSLDI